MRIVVTGGAGFIGQHAAALLAQQGHELIAVDSVQAQVHADPAAAIAGFPGELIQRDITDPSVWAALPDCDAIVHLAAETGTGQSMYEQERYTSVNVEGTRLVAQAAADRGARLLVASSRAVYGEGRHLTDVGQVGFGERPAGSTPLPSQESDPHLPVSVYGQTKSSAEETLVPLRGRIPISVIRPQNVVGPGQSLHNPYTGVLAAFVARLREERPIAIYGSGLQTRDMVHVEDVAEVIAHLIAEHDSLEEIRTVNVGTGARMTLLDIAHACIAASGVDDARIEHIEVSRAGDIVDACADLSFARTCGLPAPQFTGAEAVGDFVRWAWDRPGAPSRRWDDALGELRKQGLSG